MIRKYKVKRDAVDYYSITEYELNNGRWELLGGTGGQWPYLNHKANISDPHKPLRKDGQSYTFFACVWDYINPALIGKGWYNSQGEEIPDKPYFLAF